ncbi:MAG: histidine kinase [Bacteroidia bacterium]|nr:histidine kinase [Bacteroidia bacterium]
MKKIFVYIILLGFAQIALGQSNQSYPEVKKDAKSYEWKNANTKEGRKSSQNSEYLIKQAETLSKKNPTEAVDLIEGYFSFKYRDDIDPYKDQQAYFLLGKIYLDLERYNSAIDAFLKANSIKELPKSNKSTRKKKKRFSTPARVDPMILSKYLGIAYSKAAKPEPASKWLTDYLRLAQSRGDVPAQVDAETLMGDLWTAQGSPKKGELHYQNAIKLSSNTGGKRSYVNSLDKLGRNYQTQGNTFEARQEYIRKKEVAEELEDDTLVAKTYEQIAETFEEENNLDSAIYNEKKALNSLNIARDSVAEVKKKNRISSLYLRKEETKEAINILQEGLAVAEKIGEVDAQARAHELLAEGFEKEGKIDKALFHYKKARILNDTIEAERTRKFRNILSQNEQIASKDKKIATLEKEQELQDEKIKSLQEREASQRRIMYLLGIGLLIVSISAFLVIRSNRARRRSNQLLALKSLRSQMNPHFIFNSLNSINGFIARHDDRTANKYLSDFARLMRTVLDHSQQDFVSLATEVEVLKLYVKLEHFRFGDKFDYELQIDENLDVDKLKIPPMLIQPYIENAIWHGLRYKPEKGELFISIHEEGEKRLIINILDNGIGRQQSALMKTKNQKSHKSTGLKNTSQRLDIIKDLYQYPISVILNDPYPEKEHTGTQVILEMPLRKKED